ncbi:hypothetical protein GH714_044040 [Hevea brasiliensis]|uniref:Uncharacterized protein n=1 Tax=Hevea brasiliensis TaxID=3981 RepID=A0A6A6K0V5_HEVBR|nr:hypothetical protein GH714_044040 [Hevea brasiliensis]
MRFLKWDVDLHGEVHVRTYHFAWQVSEWRTKGKLVGFHVKLAKWAHENCHLCMEKPRDGCMGNFHLVSGGDCRVHCAVECGREVHLGLVVNLVAVRFIVILGVVGLFTRRGREVEGKMEDMWGKMVLLARLVARKCGTNPHSTISITTAKVERPKPGAAKSEGSARENFHSREKDRGRGSRAVLKCYRCRGPHKKRDCPKKAVFLAKGEEPGKTSAPLEPASEGSLPCCSFGAMSLVGPSEAPSGGAVDICGTREQSELPKKLPPEGEVGCVSEPAAGCPSEVELPKQERAEATSLEEEEE